MDQKFKYMTSKDKLVVILSYAVLSLYVLAILIPLGYIVIASFMDPNILNSQGISFDFSDWSLEGYKRVFSNEMIWRGFFNSVVYSTSFSCLSVAVCLLAAYPLSKPDFVGKGFFNTMFVITMFFSGGLMPTYLLIDGLGMIDTIWSIILPGAVSAWNIILIRTYFKTIPSDLGEASAIDGASELLHFFKILLPLCKPIIAVIFLWQFVGMWNSYFDAMIYLEDPNLQPLQLVLRSILIQNTPDPGMVTDIQSAAEMSKIAELLKYSTIVVSSIPLLAMYPFFQKYFDEGVMVGSIKG